MMRKSVKSRECSVERTLDILGDRWIFLILREAFFRVRYFDQFQENLGIATNILSDRLRTLVENGVMEKRKDRRDARRTEYRLTEKGLDIYPVVLALMQWGDRWLSGEEGPPLVLRHDKCGRDLAPVMTCEHCGERISARDVSFEEK